MAEKKPPNSGCFSTSFPSTDWTETPCSDAEPVPHPLRLDIPVPAGGKGVSPLAITVPPMSAATGELAQVSGVTSETDPSGAARWSLQLNANLFDNKDLCGGVADCGWEQFVADNPGNVFIQYWLLGHTDPCPAVPAGLPGKWQYFAGDAVERPGCFMNGHQTPAPTQKLSDLQGLRVTGSSTPSGQSATFETADGHLTVAFDAGDPLAIGGKWTQAEFNIFGTCCGRTITFNPGASIVVRISVDDGDVTSPTCGIGGGFTAESSNLNPASPCAGYPGVAFNKPGVQFTEDQFTAIPGCAPDDGAAACVAIPGSDFTDASFTPTCPAVKAPMTMQVMNEGVWQSLPQHCSDGTLPGHCGPGAAVANQFVLNTQRYGVSWSGSPIGSTQAVQVCDDALHCSRFKLSVPRCPSLVAPGDSFKLSDGNNPIEVTASGAIDANLVLDGPWVSWDHGVGATGTTVGGARLPPGTVVSLAPGVSGAPHSYATMSVSVAAPPNAPPGDYQFQANATDHASKVTLRTIVPLRILACKPQKVCSASVLNFCGAISDGCGGSVDCGACASGDCSNGVCCPAGSFYNTSWNGCEPNACPGAEVFCEVLGSCATTKACDQANTPICHKLPTGQVVCE